MLGEYSPDAVACRRDPNDNHEALLADRDESATHVRRFVSAVGPAAGGGIPRSWDRWLTVPHTFAPVPRKRRRGDWRPTYPALYM